MDEILTLANLDETGASYAGRRVKRLAVSASHFVGCAFDDTSSATTVFGLGKHASQYVDCTFDRCRLARGSGTARFVRCSFRDVVLKDWTCFAIEMIDCVFTGVLRDCYFNGTIVPSWGDGFGRTKNEFRGNDFTGARLEGVDFRTGIDLSLQALPVGPDYVVIHDATSVLVDVRRRMDSWSNNLERDEAEPMLGVLERSARNGQRDLFFDVPVFLRRKPDNPAVLKLVDLLRQYG